MRVNKRTIYVPAEQFDRLEREMMNGADDKTGRGECMFDVSANFGDGFEVDIRIYNAEGDLPWSEGVLYKDGHEVCCTQVAGCLGGEYIMDDSETNQQFSVHVVRSP